MNIRLKEGNKEVEYNDDSDAWTVKGLTQVIEVLSDELDRIVRRENEDDS